MSLAPQRLRLANGAQLLLVDLVIKANRESNQRFNVP